MDEIGIGVIGCGVIGNVHLSQLAEVEGARVAAVADLRDEAAKAAAEKWDVPAVYNNAEALLADSDVDAVVVATLANTHAELAIEAAQAGKHVLVEKPIAMNAGQVRSMIAAQGDRLGACCSCRFRLFETAEHAANLTFGGADFSSLFLTAQTSVYRVETAVRGVVPGSR